MSSNKPCISLKIFFSTLVTPIFVIDFVAVFCVKVDNPFYFDGFKAHYPIVLTTSSAAKVGFRSCQRVVGESLISTRSLVRREISVDVITERHVRSLLKLKEEELQLEALNRIYKNNLNVRQTDDLVETMLIREEKSIREQKKKKMMKAIKDMKIFVNTIKGTVKTIQDAGLPAEVSEREDDDYLEVVIRLPKKDLQQNQDIKAEENAAG